MRRRIRLSKKIFAFILLPIFVLVSSTLAYGVLQNYISFNLSLAPAQKPVMSVSCAFVNSYRDAIAILVNQNTRIIETVEPTYPLFRINITNVGETPIEKITLNNVIPKDWVLRQVNMQLVQADTTQIDIDSSYFTIEHVSENNVTITTENIKNIIGKALSQNESIIVNLYMEYKLVGQALPEEYELNPPIYRNFVSAAVWIGNWQSKFVDMTTTLISYIYWI